MGHVAFRGGGLWHEHEHDLKRYDPLVGAKVGCGPSGTLLACGEGITTPSLQLSLRPRWLRSQVEGTLEESALAPTE